MCLTTFCSLQVLFGLSASVDLDSLADDLLLLLSKETSSGVLSGTVASSEYRTRTTVYWIPALFFGK